MFIDDSTDLSILLPPDKATGLIARDYRFHPVGYLACAPAMRSVNIPLIPRSEWPARIKEGEAEKSFLSHVRLAGNGGQPIPSLDQGQVGYCWAHSTAHALTLLRAVQGEVYVPLSAYAVAATIKQGRDEGGWGALSLEFVTARGIPSQEYWPQGDRNYRAHDKPDVWGNAAQHKAAEGWVDLDAAVYDRDLTFDQVMTLLLARIPVVLDYNWWSHSVCGLDPVETSPGQFGVRIWNSWSDGWGDKGTGVLSGKRAIPDGAVAPRVTTPSVN